MIGVFGYVWLGSFVVAGVILLAGSIVPTNRNRRLSDWAMLGGMVLTFLSLVGLALLVFVFEPSYPPLRRGLRLRILAETRHGGRLWDIGRPHHLQCRVSSLALRGAAPTDPGGSPSPGAARERGSLGIRLPFGGGEAGRGKSCFGPAEIRRELRPAGGIL